MKRKYRGMFAIVFTLVTVIATIIYAFNFSSSNKRSRSRIMAPITDQINLPKKSDLKNIKKLTPKMPGLVFPSGSGDEPADLSLFGYKQQNEEEITVEDDGTTITTIAPIVRMKYSLSFAFLSGGKKYCIVDGKFYSEGADLPNGGKIEAIKSNCILVSKHGVTKWIFVTGPEIRSKLSKTVKNLIPY